MYWPISVLSFILKLLKQIQIISGKEMKQLKYNKPQRYKEAESILITFLTVINWSEDRFF